MAKKTPTIQNLVDTYANSIVRRGALQAQTTRNEGVITETGNALVNHVGETSSARVAFHAKNGKTVVVAAAPPWAQGIETIEPGSQKPAAKAEPATATIADEVATLLAKGAHEEAQKMIAGVVGEAAEAARETATAVFENDWSRYAKGYAGYLNEYRIRPAPRMYFSTHTDREEPAILQKTYKSATMGPFTLSERGKQLLTNNRLAIQRAVSDGDYNANGMAVSASRGNIAQYLSQLERTVNELTAKLG